MNQLKMAALSVAFAVTIFCAKVVTAGEDYPAPTNLRVHVLSAWPREKVHVKVEWGFNGTAYSFFKVSWGKVGLYPETVSTAIKHLTIDTLEFGASYTVRVDAFFRIDGKDEPKTSVNASFDAVGALLPPRDVEVADLDMNRVLLGWRVDPPSESEVKTSDLSFAVEYETPGQPSRLMVVNSNTAKLEGLEKATQYTVTITTMLENWRNATLPSYEFKTRGEDWPAAVLHEAKVISKGTEDKAIYDFSWDLPETESLSQFEVVVCASTCVEVPTDFKEKHLQYPLDYYTDFNVTVRTVYSLPLNQTAARLSTMTKGKTTVGTPGSVDFQSIEQQLNKLVLKWEPPEITRGPISFYEVTVWDAFDPELRNSGPFNVTEARIELPHLTKDDYKVTLTAVAKDGTTGEEFRSAIENENLRSLELIAPPTAVERIGCTPNSIDIQVTPSSRLQGILYGAQWHGGKNQAWFYKETGSISKLHAYENVSLSVRSCFLDAAELPRCGESLTWQSYSNVDRPLEVRSFSAEVEDDDSIKLKWEKPSVLNGPLNGYVIEISEPSLPTATRRNFTVLHTDLAFEIRDAVKGTLYNVTIAAFNVDLNNGEPVIGEAVYTLVHTRGPAGWVIPVAVLVVLVVLGVGVIVFYVRRNKMSASNPPMMRFSFLSDYDYNGRQGHRGALVND